MKPVQLLALFLAVGCAQAPAQDNQQWRAAHAPRRFPATDAEQEAIMDRIEREVRLPEGAGAARLLCPLLCLAAARRRRPQGVAVYDRLDRRTHRDGAGGPRMSFR